MIIVGGQHNGGWVGRSLPVKEKLAKDVHQASLRCQETTASRSRIRYIAAARPQI
jgi:hypothetical protein